MDNSKIVPADRRGAADIEASSTQSTRIDQDEQNSKVEDNLTELGGDTKFSPIAILVLLILGGAALAGLWVLLFAWRLSQGRV